jgi:hypothetical protein
VVRIIALARSLGIAAQTSLDEKLTALQPSPFVVSLYFGASQIARKFLLASLFETLAELQTAVLATPSGMPSSLGAFCSYQTI